LIAFFDTSALVPLFGPYHENAEACREAFLAIQMTERFCSQHSLAEVFNTVTKTSSPRRAEPWHAIEFLQYLQRGMTIVPLAPEDYLEAARSVTSHGLGGPMIYDALLLQCARKVNAETIYTWNVRHFQRLAPDLATRIRTP
jgi:predicted nucleic acid-binding protein